MRLSPLVPEGVEARAMQEPKTSDEFTSGYAVTETIYTDCGLLARMVEATQPRVPYKRFALLGKPRQASASTLWANGQFLDNFP
jgi:hypothetical protein